MGDNSGRAGPRRSQQLQTVFRYDYVLSRYQSSLWVSLSLLPLEACLEDSDAEGCAGARASLSHCPHHCWGVALPWDIARGHNLPPNSTNSFMKLEPQVCHRWLGRPVTLRIWCVCPLPDSLALLSLRSEAWTSIPCFLGSFCLFQHYIHVSSIPPFLPQLPRIWRGYCLLRTLTSQNGMPGSSLGPSALPLQLPERPADQARSVPSRKLHSRSLSRCAKLPSPSRSLRRRA